MRSFLLVLALIDVGAAGHAAGVARDGGSPSALVASPLPILVEGGKLLFSMNVTSDAGAHYFVSVRLTNVSRTTVKFFGPEVCGNQGVCRNFYFGLVAPAAKVESTIQIQTTQFWQIVELRSGETFEYELALGECIGPGSSPFPLRIRYDISSLLKEPNWRRRSDVVDGVRFRPGERPALVRVDSSEVSLPCDRIRSNLWSQAD